MQATWWGQTPGGNLYWRCEVPARHLPGQVLQLRYDDLQPTADGMEMPRQLGGTSIWAYAGNATRGILMAAQKVAGYNVLLEVDDDYTIGPPLIPRAHTDWRRRVDLVDDKHTIDAHRRLAEVVSGVVVTTETLARSYRRYNENVHVCPNSVDLGDWDEPEKPDDGILRIGYAASHSHWFDAADVQRALSWASDQPNVEVLLYGLTLDWPFVTKVPWTKDLAEYRKSLQLLDVGLCPLRPGAWANCKSDIKAMEYAMAGAMPIVSHTEPYRPWWDGPCLVADTPKDFLKHVKWCVRNRDGVKWVAKEAKRYVVNERTIESSIEKWRIACTPQ